MQYSTIILALTAAASAIDIRLHNGAGNKNCAGSYLACVGINPGVCCTPASSTRYSRAAYAAIPTNWNLILTGWYNGGCSTVGVTASVSNSNYRCVADPNPTTNLAFSGATYAFAGKRRRGEGERCEEVQPNLFVLEDSTEYDLVDMPEPLVETLVCIPLLPFQSLKTWICLLTL